MSPRLLRHTLPLSLTLVLGSCGGEGGTDVQAVSSVTVSPSSTTLVSLGATEQLSATALDVDGSALAGATFTWSSDARGVATVDGDGVVTAVSNGTATVTASTEGASGTATVRVAQEASAISLEIADDTVPAGGGTSIEAAVRDAGGSDLEAPELTWSSSDEDVATVDEAGAVTGVAEGEAVITASQDGVEGSVEVVVVRPDLTIERDTTVAGSIVVAGLSVADGVAVTLSGDVTVDADGPVALSGTLEGDCVALAIEGAADVTVSGTLRNACVATPMGGASAPPLRITAPGPVVLDGSELVSSGPITVTSTGTAGAPAGAGPLRQAEATPGLVSLVGSSLRAEPATAPEPDDPSSRPDGADVHVEGRGGIRLNGTTVRAQHGAPGVPVSETSSEPLEADGGRGGHGGRIELVRGDEGILYFSDSRGPTRLVAGDGGPGGPVTATTTQNGSLETAPSATALGGAGGVGGSVRLEGGADAILEGETTDISSLVAQPGRGGRGGNATAIAADGVPADASRTAQPGGSATARAGSGGSAGDQRGALFEGQSRGERRDGGSGGHARARAGRGGDGSLRGDRNGAEGGEAFSRGGFGGTGYRRLGGVGGSATSEGGDGGRGVGACPSPEEVSLTGEIAVSSDPASSDQHIFQAGDGEVLDLLLRIAATGAEPGGNGGGGGILAGEAGLGGRNSLSSARAEGGSLTFGPGGNGGDGGEGSPGGEGGAAGVGDPGGVEEPILVQDVFRRGEDGPTCGAAASPADRVARSPGVFPIEVRGDAPWVDVEGTWDDETGAVSATGRGTVAGFPDILVEFEGTWDPETQTLSGTYTIDSEKRIHPDHPVVYAVTVSGG